MIKTTITTLIMLLLQLDVWAENWEYIRTSGEYYYGVGKAATEEEAIQIALADMASQIAVHVSSDFKQIDDATMTNGTLDHKSKVLNCIKSYSQATFKNTQGWIDGKIPNITAYRYMKKSELSRIYNSRIQKAKDMIEIADECLNKRKIDMALQYYYWAYSLIRSLQFPNEVRDDNDKLMVDHLPLKIKEILDDISVSFDKRDGDFVDLYFKYNGKPVSSIGFSYSDGRATCEGSAKDGRGMIQMAPGYHTDVYHIDIEYEYLTQARGDDEMQSVLEVIGHKTFANAAFVVQGKSNESTKAQTKKDDDTGIKLAPKKSQIADNTTEYSTILTNVIEAIKTRNYSNAAKYFTIDGLEMYNQLISYGTGRIVGTPSLQFFKGLNGTTVVRGMQMSFAFNKSKKITFVEDVVFSFNAAMKIENVSFGLGQIAENDILCRHAPGWKDETREMLMEFLENYKTAYCLKRLDYIRNVFADDAVIIIGNVAKRRNTPNIEGREVTIEGQDVIKYNRYTKDQYLKNLERSFARNEFVNIRFTNNDIQWLEKYDKEEIFAIQIGQEYNSSTYADKGYLFLMVDMTNHEEPQIKVRTWQPNEVSIEKLYNAGDFYND